MKFEDFWGNIWPDIYVAEMGLEKNEIPQHRMFLNHGDDRFEERTIETDVTTHETKTVDIDGDCRTDIVGKSYESANHVDVWYNGTE